MCRLCLQNARKLGFRRKRNSLHTNQQRRRDIAELDQRRALERALELNGDDQVLQTRYLYELTGISREALAYAQRVTAGRPPHRPQLECMALIQLQMGYPEQSLATLEKLIPVYPNDPDLVRLAKEARKACLKKGAAQGAR